MALKATKKDEAADRLLTRAVLCWPGHDCPQNRDRQGAASSTERTHALPRRE